MKIFEAMSNPRFKRFVATRRKWFVIVFVVLFIVLVWFTGKKYNSTIEIFGFSLIGSLVLTVIVSLLSIPVIWIITGKEKGK
jgi:hypothetical protein